MHARLLGFVALLAAFTARGQYEEALFPVPKDAKTSLQFDRGEFFLGENVLAHFVVENTGSEPFQISVGGDYRGSPRALRFHVTATDANGRAVEDPFPNPSCYGGIGGPRTVKPGGRFVSSLPLMRYCDFTRPGRYHVTVTHDLGWIGDHPLAEADVTFLMPDAAQAEKVVAAMETLPQEMPFVSDSEPVAAFADFSALRLPVYREPLARRVAAGDLRGLEGLQRIPTPEATESLIALAENDDPKISEAAALALNSRLPDPAFRGELPSRGPFVFEGKTERQRLSERSWKAEFSPRVREVAKRLLARDSGAAASAGAFMIESVGVSDDAPAVLAAIDRALKAIPGPRARLEGAIEEPPQPLNELLRAMTMLERRGFALSGDSGGAMLAGLARRAKKPDAGDEHWREQFRKASAASAYPLRQAAMNSLPAMIPEEFAPAVRSAMKDADPGVRLAACDAAGRSGDGKFLPALIDVVSTDSDEWALNAASNAAYHLKGGYDLMTARASRLDEEGIYNPALDFLIGALDFQSDGSSGRTDLGAEERKALQTTWQQFLQTHEKDLRAGRKVPLDAPDVGRQLVGRARVFDLTGGGKWPAD